MTLLQRGGAALLMACLGTSAQADMFYAQVAPSPIIHTVATDHVEQFQQPWEVNRLKFVMSMTVNYTQGFIEGHLRDMSCIFSGHVWELQIEVNGRPLETKTVRMYGSCGVNISTVFKGRAMPGNLRIVATPIMENLVTHEFNIRATEYRAAIDFPYKACMTATQPAQPMYYARLENSDHLDSFYTTQLDHYQIAQNIGFRGYGPAFKVESDTGWVGDRTMPESAKPWQRFYGAAATDHFYTLDANESSHVRRYLGYDPEGIEGYVYPTQVPNTVALRRFAYFVPSRGDTEHIYTIHDSFAAQLTASGWGNDGVVGYVCAP